MTIEEQGVEKIEQNMQLVLRQAEYAFDILHQLIDKEGFFILEALSPRISMNGIHPV